MNSETVGPLMLAIAQGEFEKENLDVSVEVLPIADALPLVTSGELNIYGGTVDAGFFNAVSTGYGLKSVLGSYYSSEESQAGLWGRADLDLCDLAGKQVASSTGIGSVVNYPIGLNLEECGLTVADLDWVVLPATDIPLALTNRGVDAGILTDPRWGPFVDNSDFHFLSPITRPGESILSAVFGPSMFEMDHAVGEAYVRAIVRTISTYLSGDYKADPKVVKLVAEALDVPEDTLLLTPSLVYDYEIREGLSARVQTAFKNADVLMYEDFLSEEETVDRSYLEFAVGASYVG